MPVLHARCRLLPPLLPLLLLLLLFLAAASIPLPPHVVAQPPDDDTSPIRVGVFECTDPSPLACFVPRIDLLHSMWFDRVNRRRAPGILGRRVVPVVTNISGSLLAGEIEIGNATQRLIDQGVHFVIFPIGNNVIARGAALLDKYQIPGLAGGTVYSSIYRCDRRSWCAIGCECPDGVRPPSYQVRRRFQYLHSPSNVDESYVREWVAMLRVKRASTIAVVRIKNAFFDAIAEGLPSLARDYSMRVIHSAVAPAIGAVVSLSDALKFVEQLQSAGADGVCLLVVTCAPWIEAMRQLDYTPPSLISLNCIDNSLAVSQVERNFVSGSAQWDARLSTSEYTEKRSDPWALYGLNFSSSPGGDDDVPADGVGDDRFYGRQTDVISAMMFARQWQRVYNDSSVIPGYTFAEHTAAFEMLNMGIVLANSTRGPAVNAALKGLEGRPSFYGLLGQNSFGYNERKPMLILQQDHLGAVQIVAPIQFATADFVYPTPKWSERVYVQGARFRMVVEQVFLVLVVTCSAMTLCLMAYLLMRWDSASFRASGPATYLLVSLGSLVGYASVLVWGVENDAAQCSARMWVVTLAFHITIQPLFFATRHVYSIYCNSMLQLDEQRTADRVQRQRREQLIRFLAILPPIILNLIAGGGSAFETDVVVPDALRPGSTAYTLCKFVGSPAEFVGIITAHCIYGGSILVATCIYAYRIRTLPDMYHDAHALAYSVYLFALAVLCIVVTQGVLGDGGAQRSVAQLSFALRAGAMLIGYQACSAILLGSRIQCDSGRPPSKSTASHSFPHGKPNANPQAVGHRDRADGLTHRPALHSSPLYLTAQLADRSSTFPPVRMPVRPVVTTGGNTGASVNPLSEVEMSNGTNGGGGAEYSPYAYGEAVGHLSAFGGSPVPSLCQSSQRQTQASDGEETTPVWHDDQPQPAVQPLEVHHPQRVSREHTQLLPSPSLVLQSPERDGQLPQQKSPLPPLQAHALRHASESGTVITLEQMQPGTIHDPQSALPTPEISRSM